MTNNNEIYTQSNPKQIITDKLDFIQNEIKNKEGLYSQYFNDPQAETLINKQFTPSKTAQNGLNFVNKDEEANLCKKEQADEIINVFRLIYLLIDEKLPEDLAPAKYIDNLLHTILPKLNVENLSIHI